MTEAQSRDGAGREEADPFMIIVVCDGNICRSPLVELALRQWLPEDRFTVRSAGLTPLIGHPMDLQMQRVARQAGLEPRGFRATGFDPRHANTADLVLTMTRAQRDTVAGRAPRLLRRTLCLSEALINFAPDHPDDPVESGRGRLPASSIREVVRAAVARRSTTRLTADDDIPDPYRGDDALFEAVGHRLLAAADTLAGRFTVLSTRPSMAATVEVRR